MSEPTPNERERFFAAQYGYNCGPVQLAEFREELIAPLQAWLDENQRCGWADPSADREQERWCVWLEETIAKLREGK